MAGSIRSCPACKALLLRETVQCPECNHVFDEGRRQQMTEAAPAAPAERKELEQEKCPSCSELVRRGMVRCWNCGGFMREDIGELYKKMQAKPAPVIFSGSSRDSEIYSVEEVDDAVLSEDSSKRREDDFELADDLLQSPATASSGTYSLSETAAPQQPAPAAAPENTAAPENSVAGGDPSAGEEQSAEPGDDEKSSQDEAERDSTEQSAAQENAEKPAQPHSEATGGDALLQIAMEEELETGKRRKQPRRKQGKDRVITGFLVFCPHGHRIEVQDRHRGKAGRCPRCKSVFIVPDKAPEPAQPADAEQQAGEAAATDQPPSDGAYSRWMTDVRLHTVNPEKLRLKAGSLEKEFQPVDVGFSTEDVLIATLPAAKGLFGLSGGKKNDEAREAFLTALREETPLDDLPLAEKRVIPKDSLQQLAIDQPVIYEHESMFVGIPVFGPGRIAVRLPKAEAKDQPTFLSFDLSGFRRFSTTLEELYGIEEFGALNEVPLTDEFTEVACHYSEEKFRTLENAEFYQHDSQYTLKLVGRKCAGCGLVISEDSRKKEKIGGAKGNSIAKAACPKCKQKFGDTSLFDLEAPPGPDGEQAEQPEQAAAAAEA